MSEIKSATFRLGEKATEQFRAYCEEYQLTAAQGFDRLVEKISVVGTEEDSRQALEEVKREKAEIIDNLAQIIIEQRAEIKALKAELTALKNKR